MEWLVDDELMRRWEELSKDEAEIKSEKKQKQKATRGESAQRNRACRRAGANGDEGGECETKRMVAGWSQRCRRRS